VVLGFSLKKKKKIFYKKNRHPKKKKTPKRYELPWLLLQQQKKQTKPKPGLNWRFTYLIAVKGLAREFPNAFWETISFFKRAKQKNRFVRINH